MLYKGLVSFAICNIYIDYMIVFSSSVDEHLEPLHQVFDQLRAVGVKLHPVKCEFAFPKVDYLGHVITAEGSYPIQIRLRQ